jgi:NADH-quinone oxidoreductase subunit G
LPGSHTTPSGRSAISTGSVIAPRSVLTFTVTPSPSAVFADLPDGVVWLPGNSDGSAVFKTLGAGHGAVVNLAGGGH